jgi:predicted MFS family arabinose efflux permease
MSDGSRVSDASGTSSYPSSARAWYTVAILFLAYTLSFVDRQIFAFLVDPIKADFQISDSSFAFMSGFGFVIIYTVLGIPIGRLADSHNRRNIMAAGIAVWSFMTAFCGIAANYWQLFLGRFGVGVGEAALSPCAYSMITDNFPREKRSLPLNVYSAGILVGAGLANIFGGLATQAALSMGPQDVPLLGTVKAWQFAFLLVGIPGVIIALLVLTLKEPARHERRAEAKFAQTFRYISAHRGTYITLIVGVSLFATSNYAIINWIPAYYDRNFGWSRAQLGGYFGAIIAICGAIGLVASGILATKMLQAGVTAVFHKLMIGAECLVLVGFVLLVAVHDPYWTMGCLVILFLGLSFHVGLGPVALQSVTPNEMRGQVIAIYFLILNITANGIFNQVVAGFTDFFFVNPADVGKSVALVGTGATIVGIASLIIGVKFYKRTVREIGV